MKIHLRDGLPLVSVALQYRHQQVALYDFSTGERGKFYRPEASLLTLPVYLEPDVDTFMRQVSLKTGKDVEKLVNEWLRSNIKLVESTQ